MSLDHKSEEVDGTETSAGVCCDGEKSETRHNANDDDDDDDVDASLGELCRAARHNLLIDQHINCHFH